MMGPDVRGPEETNPLIGPRKKEGAQPRGSLRGRNVDLSTAAHLALTETLRKAGAPKPPTTTLKVTIDGKRRTFKLEMHKSENCGTRIIVKSGDKNPVKDTDVEWILGQAKKDLEIKKGTERTILQCITDIGVNGKRTRIDKGILEETKRLLDQYKKTSQEPTEPPPRRRFFSRSPLPDLGDIEGRFIDTILKRDSFAASESPIPAGALPGETSESQGNSPASAAPPQEGQPPSWHAGVRPTTPQKGPSASSERTATSPQQPPNPFPSSVSSVPTGPLPLATSGPIPSTPPSKPLPTPPERRRAESAATQPADRPSKTFSRTPQPSSSPLEEMPPLEDVPDEVYSVHDLREKLTSLGKINKLVWDKKKKELSVAPRDFSIQSRTGASSGAQEAAEQCLKIIQDLLSQDQVTTNPPAMKELQEALLALVASEWFHGVIEHHGESLKPLLLKTIKGLCEKLSEENQTPFLASCSATMARINELQQFAKNLPKELFGGGISDKINEIRPQVTYTIGSAPKITPETMKKLEGIKVEIDHLKLTNPKLADDLYGEFLGILHNDGFIEAVQKFSESLTDRKDLQSVLSAMIRLAEPTRQTSPSTHEQEQQKKLTELRNACAKKYCDLAKGALTLAVQTKDAEKIYTILSEIRDLQAKAPDPQTEESLVALQEQLIDLVRANREMFETMFGTLEKIVAPMAEDRKKIAEGALERTGENFDFFQQQIVNEKNQYVKEARMRAVVVPLLKKYLSSKDKDFTNVEQIIIAFSRQEGNFLQEINDPTLIAAYLASRANTPGYTAEWDRGTGCPSDVDTSPSKIQEASDTFSTLFNDPFPNALSPEWKEKAGKLLQAAHTLDAAERNVSIQFDFRNAAEKVLSRSLDTYKGQKKAQLNATKTPLEKSVSELSLGGPKNYPARYKTYQEALQTFRASLKEAFPSDKDKEMNLLEFPLEGFVSKYRTALEKSLTQQYDDSVSRAKETYFTSDQWKMLQATGKEYIDNLVKDLGKRTAEELKEFVFSDAFRKEFAETLGNPHPDLLEKIMDDLFDSLRSEKKDAITLLANSLKQNYSEPEFTKYKDAVKDLLLLSNIRYSGKGPRSIPEGEETPSFYNPLLKKEPTGPLADAMKKLSEETKALQQNLHEFGWRVKNKKPEELEKAMRKGFDGFLAIVLARNTRFDTMRTLGIGKQTNTEEPKSIFQEYLQELLGGLSAETRQKRSQPALSTTQKQLFVIQDKTLTPEKIASLVNVEKIRTGIVSLVSVAEEALNKGDLDAFDYLQSTCGELNKACETLEDIISSCSDETIRAKLIKQYYELKQMCEDSSKQFESLSRKKPDDSAVTLSTTQPPHAADILPPSLSPAQVIEPLPTGAPQIPKDIESATSGKTPTPTESPLDIQVTTGGSLSPTEEAEALLELIQSLETKHQKLGLTPENTVAAFPRRPSLPLATPGKSPEALEATIQYLQDIARLSREQDAAPKIREAFLALTKSEWIRNVVSQHPEVIDTLRATAEKIKKTLPSEEKEAFLGQLIPNVKENKELSFLVALFSEPSDSKEGLRLATRLELYRSECLAEKIEPDKKSELISRLGKLKHEIDSLQNTDTSSYYAKLSECINALDKKEFFDTSPGSTGTASSFSREEILSTLSTLIHLTKDPSKLSLSQQLVSKLNATKKSFAEKYSGQIGESLSDPNIKDIDKFFTEAQALLNIDVNLDETSGIIKKIITSCRERYASIAPSFIERATKATTSNWTEDVDNFLSAVKMVPRERQKVIYDNVIQALLQSGGNAIRTVAITQRLPEKLRSQIEEKEEYKNIFDTAKKSEDFFAAISRGDILISAIDLEKNELLEKVNGFKSEMRDNPAAIEKIKTAVFTAKEDPIKTVAIIRGLPQDIKTKITQDERYKTLSEKASQSKGPRIFVDDLVQMVEERINSQEEIQSCIHNLPLRMRENLYSEIASMPKEIQKKLTKIIEYIRKDIVQGELSSGSPDLASLSLFAGSRENFASIMKEIVSTSPKLHTRIGEAALLWAQSCEHVTLPSKKAVLFKEETVRVRKLLTEIAEALEGNPPTAALAQKLKTASEKFCTPPEPPKITPGTRPINDFLNIKEGDERFDEATSTVAQDLFHRSAAYFLSTSPMEIVFINPQESFDPCVKSDTVLTNYISSSIVLNSKDLKESQERIFFWLNVGEKALEQGDQASAQAINTAIGKRILLLKDKDNYLPGIDENHQQRLETFFSRLNTGFSYKAQREFCEARLQDNRPIIPFIGPYKTDVTFISESPGNCDETGNLSYSACNREGELVSKLGRIQDTVRNIPSQQETTIQQELANVKIPDPDAFERKMNIKTKALLGTAKPQDWIKAEIFVEHPVEGGRAVSMPPLETLVTDGVFPKPERPSAFDLCSVVPLDKALEYLKQELIPKTKNRVELTAERADKRDENPTADSGWKRYRSGESTAITTAEGTTVSTAAAVSYPLQGKERSGDPAADDIQYASIPTKDGKGSFVIYSGADGCSWGESSKTAAETANKSFVEKCLAQSLFTQALPESGKISFTLDSLMGIACQGVQAAQENVAKGEGTTTHCGIIQFNNPDGPSYAVAVTTGDMKIFVRRADGSVQELTEGNRGGIDPTDPGGRLGKQFDSGNPDIRNLSIFTIELHPGDELLPMSDGVHDNLDPCELGILPDEAFEEILENGNTEQKAALGQIKKEDLTEAVTQWKKARKGLADGAKTGNDAIDSYGPWKDTPELRKLRSVYMRYKAEQIIKTHPEESHSHALVSHAIQATEGLRQCLQDPKTKKQPALWTFLNDEERVKIKGKTDHVSCGELRVPLPAST